MNPSAQREIVRDSLPAILAKGEALAGEFHRRLFESRPELLPLFPKEETARHKNLEAVLELVKLSVEHEPASWQSQTNLSKDPLLRLAIWCRKGGPLQAVPESSLESTGLAFVNAVSATLDDCSGDQRIALSQSFARFAQAQQVLTQCAVHASGIRDRRKKNPLVLSAELDEELDLRSLLETLSLCQQYLALSFKDEEDRPSGYLLLKSGQVLDAQCQEERGQPAFRLLLARPHQRVRITRASSRRKHPALVGELLALLAQSKASSPSPRVVVDPERLAANREPLEDLPGSAENEAFEPESSGVPTPLVSAVPLEPLPSGGPMDTQPIEVEPWTLEDGKERSFRPQDLALSRAEAPFTATLQKIPHLRAVILLSSPKLAQGSFWSRDGAQISISDLSRFGQAMLWAQRQLPRLFGPQDCPGWTNTTEHALGCVVTTLDEQGRGRICLFDAATPLGKVRHTTALVTRLSDAEPAAFGA